MFFGFGAFESVIGLATLATLALFLIALVDLVQRPADVWKESGQSQLVWALIVIFIGFFGPVLYLIMARPALQAAANRNASRYAANS